MKKTLQQRRHRRLRRVNKRVKTLMQEASKEEQKIEVLQEHKDILQVGTELRELLPEYAPLEETYTLDTYLELIVLHLKAIHWPPSDNYVRKIGIARVREEVSTQVNPPLKRVRFDNDYDPFTKKNKLLLWVYICCAARGLQLGAIQQGHQGKDFAWNVRELRDEYIRYTIELWVEAGWKKKGRAFKFTSLLTRTFSLADIPVSVKFLESPFQFMALEIPPFIAVPLNRVEKGSQSFVRDILVGYVPEENQGNVKTLLIIATPSNFGMQLVQTARFDTRLTIQQNIMPL